MYRILPIKSAIKRCIEKLPAAHKARLPAAFEDIERNPFSHPLGKIGKLKGRKWHGTWHYELAYHCRIHYKTDEKSKTVKITYIGPHPTSY